MKTLLPLLLFWGSFNAVLQAQGCLNQGITFSTQAEIDQFSANYPTCHRIIGVVTIMGDDITNLDGLAGVTEIGAGLYIEYCSKLENIYGLSNLLKIGTTGPVRSLYITANPKLKNLDGLEHITTIGGNLDISENTLLENIDALSHLRSVGSMFWISSNASLKNLNGLKSLHQIGEDLIIEDSDSLTDLAGLDSLEVISGGLQIQFNAQLNSLAGLSPNLRIASIFLLGINDVLSYCSVEAVCHFLQVTPHNLSMCGNAPGCESPAEILEQCQSTGTSAAESIDRILLSPNPCTDVLNFDVEQVTQVSIFDVYGRRRLADTCNGHCQIDTRNFPEGRYFIEYALKGKRGFASFVKTGAR